MSDSFEPDVLGRAFTSDEVKDDNFWKSISDSFARNAESRGVPDYMAGGVARYVVYGISGGSFLGALLSNDFLLACGHADETNKAALFAYADCFYNDLPSIAKGSHEAVVNWELIGGLRKYVTYTEQERMEYHEKVFGERG